MAHNFETAGKILVYYCLVCPFVVNIRKTKKVYFNLWTSLSRSTFRNETNIILFYSWLFPDKEKSLGDLSTVIRCFRSRPPSLANNCATGLSNECGKILILQWRLVGTPWHNRIECFQRFLSEYENCKFSPIGTPLWIKKDTVGHIIFPLKKKTVF